MTIGRLIEHRDAAVVTCDVGTSVSDAVAVLADRRIGAMPVTRDNAVIGVFSERDVIYGLRKHGPQVLALTVGDVMTAPAVTVTVKTDNQGVIDSAHTDAQVAEARRQLDAFSAGGAQGQAFRFESWNARGVTFSSRYQRPVVVGWDGADLSFM